MRPTSAPGTPLLRCLTVAALLFPLTAHAQERTTHVLPRVFQSETHGAYRVQFELRGNGSEPIGVSAEQDEAAFASFTQLCATPCALWFRPGQHFVELGRSPLRTRLLTLTVHDRPAVVRFTRDAPAGIVAGLFLAGLGAVGMLVGFPMAASDPAHTAPWLGVAGAGLGLAVGGSVLAYFSLGGYAVLPAPER